MMDFRTLVPRRIRVTDTHPQLWMNSRVNIATSSGKVVLCGSAYRSLVFASGLSATRPTYTAAGLITFDGGDYAGSNVALTGTAGRVMAVMRHVATDASQVIFSTTKINAANTYLTLGVDATSHVRYAFNAEGAEDELTGDTVLSEAWHILEWISTGSAIAMVVDGVVQTLTIASGGNNGKWHDDVTDATNHVIGTRWSSGGKTLYYVGWLGEIIAWEPDIAAGKIGRLRMALARKYGVTLA